jgi:sterol desaturase/sphingolipid hydroxylase (fatty acid hydroxylase superfamily)
VECAGADGVCRGFPAPLRQGRAQPRTGAELDGLTVDWSLAGLTVSFAYLFAIIAVRYAAISGAFYWWLWGRPAEKVRAEKLTDIRPKRGLILSEIRWSLIASLIYAAAGLIVWIAWQSGWTLIYTGLSAWDLLYIPLSIGLYLFLHDTYFYWTHRAMHHPKLFPVIHRVHHQSKQPTPWAAFSFHWTESVIEAAILPLLVFLVPIHIGALLVVLTIMTLNGVVNHTGYEIYPKRWMRGWFGRHVITATHHNLHHTRFACNYGLYFRFWDKLMGTDRMPG